MPQPPDGRQTRGRHRRSRQLAEPLSRSALRGLPANALERAARSEIAAFSLVAEARDESPAAFYRHHSFIALLDSPLTLFLPLAAIPPSFRGLGAN